MSIAKPSNALYQNLILSRHVDGNRLLAEFLLRDAQQKYPETACAGVNRRTDTRALRLSGPAAMPIVSYLWLAEAGLARRYGETREGFAARTREVAPSFKDLTWMHLAARLQAPDAGAPGDRDERSKTGARARPEFSAETWRSTLASVRREIAARDGHLLRFLGVLNPASFLDLR